MEHKIAYKRDSKIHKLKQIKSINILINKKVHLLQKQKNDNQIFSIICPIGNNISIY